MQQKIVIVFGGSSGIGEATARVLKDAGVRVVITGRGETKLHAVAKSLGVEAAKVDAGSREAVAALFEKIGLVDYVVICVSGAKGAGAFVDLDLKDLREAFEAKTFAHLNVAQVAAKNMRAGGSITFVTATSARSVMRGTAGLAAVNGALEVVVPILAYELAPIRVNAVSPGIVDTAWWSAMPEASKRAFFQAAEKTLPARRVGNAEEVGALVAMVAQTGFITGSVFEIDGGAHIVSQ